MKAQDPISNNNNFGSYSNSGQSVILNKTSSPNNNVVDGNLNFVGGIGNSLGINNNLMSSFTYGDNNSVSASSVNNPSFVFGESNIANSGRNYIIGLSNTIDVFEAVAIGDGNVLTNSAGENICIGEDIRLDKVEAYGFGKNINVTGQEAYAIGFGSSPTDLLTNSINESMTIGVEGFNQVNLNENGRVSIGTNNSPRNAPGSKLEIRADGTSSSTSALNVKDNAGNSLFFVRDDGFVGIQTSSQLGTRTEIHQLDGNAFASGNWINGSDIRVKKDTQIISNATKKIMKLSGITFNYKENGMAKEFNFPDDRQAGIIAQEVEKVLPEAVSQHGNGIKGVAYNQLTPLLIETNKTQQKQIEKLQEKTEKVDNLKQKLQQQKAKNHELENRIEKLEKLVLEEKKKESEHGNNNGQKMQGNQLYQNSPNPFSQETTIKYRLAEKANEAQIVVTKTNGNQLNRFNISGTGYGEVTIQGGTLKPGNYVYSLIVDGRRVANRKMMLIRK